MPTFIYNSLSKKKEELKPLDGKTIKMYSCGVTVYDKCHIGHARSLYIFDVIRKYLAKYSGYKVKFIRNITDVDDKIINKAKELDKLFDDVVNENIEAYKKDLKNLGIGEADEEPRATKYIDKIIDFIEKLIKKDFAYEVDGNVYYSVRKFKDYGKLSGQSIDQMIEATRIEQDPKKKDPLDFALWKNAEEDEQSWPSPWGKGRPGWHIECSCMSMNELQSETIDIHAGGRDLIFPHHENEIAQSEALTGKPFAKYWIHHGLLTINGQKMAKSLGNFITLDEVLEEYSPDVLKFFFLQSHYRSPVDFSWDKMEEVRKEYLQISNTLKRVDKIFMSFSNEQKEKIKKDSTENNQFEFMQSGFKKAMNDDFNTPRALAELRHFITEINTTIMRHDQLKNKETNLQQLFYSCYILFPDIENIFGLSISKNLSEKPLTDDEEDILQERAEARNRKDFQRSDELRESLKEKGILVEDTKGGQVWRRI